VLQVAVVAILLTFLLKSDPDVDSHKDYLKRGNEAELPDAGIS